MKNIRILISAILIALAFTSCTQNKTNEENLLGSKTEDKQVTTTTTDVTSNKDNNEYDIVGEIIEFSDNRVSILSGCIAQNFEIEKEILNRFYLGETVSIKEITEGSYDIDHYIIENNNSDIRHTSMGELIESMTGTVNEISKEKLVLSTEDTDIEFNLYSPLELQIGDSVTVDYLTRDEKMNVLESYNENTKLELTVEKIDRDETTGIMIIEGTDNDNIKYIIEVYSGTVLNFSHSTLKPDEKITIYTEFIQESYPGQIAAKKILR